MENVGKVRKVGNVGKMEKAEKVERTEKMGKRERTKGAEVAVEAEREAFLQWFAQEIPEGLFVQIAAQVLFHCKSCCECCRGEGYCLVDGRDISEIAKALSIRPSEAKDRYTLPDPEGDTQSRILKSTGQKSACCFLDENGMSCRIYERRPGICRTFPMLNSDPQEGEPLCFFPDCLGTADFVRMLVQKSADPDVRAEIDELTDNPERLLSIRIGQYAWLARMLGASEQAEGICKIAGVSPSEGMAFERDCLVYLLMTIRTDGLDEYRYEGPEEGLIDQDRID